MQWAISQLKKKWPNPWSFDTLLDAIETLESWEIIMVYIWNLVS